MRPDLAKVVTEHPRGGSGYAIAKKYGGKVRIVHDPDHLYDDEFGGFRSSARRRQKDYKAFSDVLGPLRGALMKNVGRPWNDVYSEFNEFLDRRSISGIHIFDGHLIRKGGRGGGFVTVNGIYEGADGVVYEYQAGVTDDRQHYDYKTKTWVRNPNGKLWLALDTPVSGFYVHPTTGLLCHSNKGYASHLRHRTDYHRNRYPTKPIEIIELAWEMKGVEASRFTPTYSKKVLAEWYQRDECGRSPRNRFYAWFHYSKKTVVNYCWVRIGGGAFAKNAHFEGVEVAPYVDPIQERVYKTFPEKYTKRADGFWYTRQKNTKTKETKRSCNRKDMVIIRDAIVKGKGKSKDVRLW